MQWSVDWEDMHTIRPISASLLENLMKSGIRPIRLLYVDGENRISGNDVE